MPYKVAPSMHLRPRFRNPRQHLSRKAWSAELVSRYIDDVLEGGHLQFFVSGGGPVVAATLAALSDFQAHAYVPILSDASTRWAAKPRESQYSMGSLLDAVIAQEFADSDRCFFSCSPPWQVCLQTLHRERFPRELLTKEMGLFEGPETL